MKGLRNDQRLVAPLAISAVLFSSLTVVRVVSAARTVPAGYSTSAGVRPSAVVPTVGTQQTPVPVTTAAIRPPTRNPYFHEALALKDEDGASPTRLEPTIGDATAGPMPTAVPLPEPKVPYGPSVAPGPRRTSNIEPPALPDPPTYTYVAMFDGPDPLAVLKSDDGRTFFVRANDTLSTKDGVVETVSEVTRRAVLLTSDHSSRSVEMVWTGRKSAGADK